jgi:aminodeoxyfutalosine deaminase
MSLPPDVISSLVQRLPKVELHVHLEGSIRPEALREMARRKNQALEATEDWIRERERYAFRYPQFSDFLKAFKLVSLLLETPEDYAFAATRLIEELGAQNVRYAEVTLSAGVVLWKKQPLEPIFEAVAEAASTASRKLGLRINWIFDAVRQFDADRAREVLRYAARFRDHGVVAFGIGGDELRGPAHWFCDLFQEARELGLHTTAHAGETAGPESVRDAVEVLKAERIGHATSAGQDQETIQMLSDRKVTVEACLTSNLATGLIHRIEDYPLRRFLSAGVPVTLNSDDPALFATSLQREIILAAEHFGLSEGEIFDLVRNAVRGAFIPETVRAAMIEELALAASPTAAARTSNF